MVSLPLPLAHFPPEAVAAATHGRSPRVCCGARRNRRHRGGAAAICLRWCHRRTRWCLRGAEGPQPPSAVRCARLSWERPPTYTLEWWRNLGSGSSPASFPSWALVAVVSPHLASVPRLHSWYRMEWPPAAAPGLCLRKGPGASPRDNRAIRAEKKAGRGRCGEDSQWEGGAVETIPLCARASSSAGDCAIVFRGILRAPTSRCVGDLCFKRDSDRASHLSLLPVQPSLPLLVPLARRPAAAALPVVPPPREL